MRIVTSAICSALHHRKKQRVSQSVLSDYLAELVVGEQEHEELLEGDLRSNKLAVKNKNEARGYSERWGG